MNYLIIILSILIIGCSASPSKNEEMKLYEKVFSLGYRYGQLETLQYIQDHHKTPGSKDINYKKSWDDTEKLLR